MRTQGRFSLFQGVVARHEGATVLLSGKTWRRLLASKDVVSFIAQLFDPSNDKIRRITYFIFSATKVISSSAAFPAAQSSPVCSKRSMTACGAECALASKDSLLRS
jgi:hypothetical protein